MFLRIGVAEMIVISLICLLAIGLPAILALALNKMSARIKDLEERLKDK